MSTPAHGQPKARGGWHLGQQLSPSDAAALSTFLWTFGELSLRAVTASLSWARKHGSSWLPAEQGQSSYTALTTWKHHINTVPPSSLWLSTALRCPSCHIPMGPLAGGARSLLQCRSTWRDPSLPWCLLCHFYRYALVLLLLAGSWFYNKSSENNNRNNN